MRLWRRIVVGCVMAIGILAGGMALGFQDLGRETDPLCASIEEDPCFSDGVFEIFCAKDYLRFAGYMNRARKENPVDEEAVAVDGRLMADVNLETEERYALENHPYIRLAILSYSGTFDGNGHQITWVSEAGNGMFVCL